MLQGVGGTFRLPGEDAVKKGELNANVTWPRNQPKRRQQKRKRRAGNGLGNIAAIGEALRAEAAAATAQSARRRSTVRRKRRRVVESDDTDTSVEEDLPEAPQEVKRNPRRLTTAVRKHCVWCDDSGEDDDVCSLTVRVDKSTASRNVGIALLSSTLSLSILIMDSSLLSSSFLCASVGFSACVIVYTLFVNCRCYGILTDNRGGGKTENSHGWSTIPPDPARPLPGAVETG